MADEQTPEETPETPEAAPAEQEQPAAGSAFFPPQEGQEAPAPAEGGEPAAPAADEQLTRSYEDLARRDRELQDRTTRNRELEQQARQWQSIQQQAQDDPGAVLQQLGINPYTLPDKLLGIPEEEQQQQVPAGLTREETQQMIRESLDHQAQLMQQQQSIAQMIHGSGHELLRDKAGRDPRVITEIHSEAMARFQETGTLPDIGVLLTEREEREKANLFASLDRVMQLDIVKGRYGKLGSGNETPQAPKKDPPPPGAPQRTLSQQQKEEPRHEERPMTDEERWAEFGRALKDGPPEGWDDKL